MAHIYDCIDLTSDEDVSSLDIPPPLEEVKIIESVPKVYKKRVLPECFEPRQVEHVKNKNIIQQQPEQSNTIPIVLKSNQPENVQNITDILTRSKFAIDNSMAGAGKTIMSLAVCKNLGYDNVIVICPAGTISEWKRQIVSRGFSACISIDVNGIPTELDNVVIGYESLRATSGPALGKHKLLHAKLVAQPPNDSGEVKFKQAFEASPLLQALVKTKVLFIFDEFHRMKNATSLQYIACSEITKLVCSNTHIPSKCLFLSATPFDKSVQIVGFLNSVGIIPNKFLVGPPLDINPAKYGMGEFVRYCYNLDPVGTKTVIDDNKKPSLTFVHIPSDKTKAPPTDLEILLCKLPSEKTVACDVVTKLYSRVLSKHFVSAAPSYSLPFDLDIADGYFNMSPTNAMELYKSIQGLKTAYAVQQREGITNFGILIYWLKCIENAKVEIFVRKIHQLLQQDPNCKVLCFLNYHSTMEAVHEALNSLGVANTYVSKGTSVEDRESMIAPIMEHNNNHRVLIGNTTVLGVGLNLDDQSPGGKFPRHCLISPSYLYMTLHQAAYRCYRANTTSQPTVRYVYGKLANVGEKTESNQVDLIEAKLLKNMATKTTVMKFALTHQMKVQQDIKFPGQHPVQREEDEYLEQGIYSKFAILLTEEDKKDSVEDMEIDDFGESTKEDKVKAELLQLLATEKDRQNK